MFWTGVPKLSVLNFLFEWISPLVEKITLWMDQKRDKAQKGKARKRTLSLFNEFVLVLIRIRRGWAVRKTSAIFGVSACHISRIFTTLINLLYNCFLPLLEWPSADIIKQNMPASFKTLFLTTRVLIDFSELFIQKLRCVDAQRLTHSQYKSHNTFKFLLGIAPSGQITFLSKLYTGSLADRDIVTRSGFINLISKNDNVMADMGFNIRDLLLKKNAFLNIPAFLEESNCQQRLLPNQDKIQVLEYMLNVQWSVLKILKYFKERFP